jgi:hypothetical protein
MNAERKSTASNSEAGADMDSGAGKIPNTDMQPEDAGTPESGNTGGRGNAAETAMKQTSKTGKEKGTDDNRS